MFWDDETTVFELMLSLFSFMNAEALVTSTSVGVNLSVPVACMVHYIIQKVLKQEQRYCTSTLQC